VYLDFTTPKGKLSVSHGINNCISGRYVFNRDIYQCLTSCGWWCVLLSSAAHKYPRDDDTVIIVINTFRFTDGQIYRIKSYIPTWAMELRPWSAPRIRGNHLSPDFSRLSLLRSQSPIRSTLIHPKNNITWIGKSCFRCWHASSGYGKLQQRMAAGDTLTSLPPYTRLAPYIYIYIYIYAPGKKDVVSCIYIYEPYDGLIRFAYINIYIYQDPYYSAPTQSHCNERNITSSSNVLYSKSYHFASSLSCCVGNSFGLVHVFVFVLVLVSPCCLRYNFCR